MSGSSRHAVIIILLVIIIGPWLYSGNLRQSQTEAMAHSPLGVAASCGKVPGLPGYSEALAAGEPYSSSYGGSLKFSSSSSGQFVTGTITLAVSVVPPMVVTLTVNGQTYNTDSGGSLHVSVQANSTTFTIVAPDNVPVSSVSKYVFTGWTGGASSSSSTVVVQATSNVGVTANYKAQYLVTVSSLRGTPAGGGWFDANSTASISVNSPVNATQAGTRYVFKAWSGDFSGSANPAQVAVKKGMNITATWTTQYYLLVDSGGHGPAGGSNWYNASASATINIVPPQPSNGTWFVFRGWSGDFSGSTNPATVTVTKPMHVIAVWRVLLQMKINYIDSKGVSVPPSSLSAVVLTAPNGSQVQLKSPTASTGFWLDTGAWKVLSVIVLGVNVATTNQTFTASPNGSVALRLKLYDVAFVVTDSVFGRPIEGATVNVTLPNGSSDSVVTAADGTAVVSQLPSGDYVYLVTKSFTLQSSGKMSISGVDVETSVKLIVLSSVGIVFGVVVAAIVVALLVIRRRRGGGVPEIVGRRRSSVADILEGGEGTAEDQPEEDADVESAQSGESEPPAEAETGSEEREETGEVRSPITLDAAGSASDRLFEFLNQTTTRAREEEPGVDL